MLKSLISGKQNPYDLRPALDAIESRVETLLQNEDRPLFILFGENHINTCDLLLRQAIVERLARNKNTAPKGISYGAEIDTNMLEWLIENWFGVNIPENKKGKIKETDTHGKKFLKAAHAAYIPTNSPYARRNLWACLLDMPLSYRCNDTPRTEDDIHLDQSKPEIRALISRIFGTEHAHDKIDLASPNGLLVRNHFMAAQAIAHQQDTGAQLYIQDCGRHHLYGNRKESIGYKGSLSQIFADKGQRTLVITSFANGYTQSNLPTDGAKSAFQREAIAVTDFAHASFSGLFNEEIKAIKKFHKSSGMEFSLYEQEIPDEETETYKQVEAEIPQWISNACPD